MKVKVWLAALLALAPSCAAPARREPKIEKIEVEGCRNVFRPDDRVISGSEPQGEAAFRALAALGVKTILTVDGAEPDVEGARRHGIRYVHLPIGYDGIHEERAAEIAKAVAELPGPVYFHCFHGQHRGPAAAALALVAVRGWASGDAVRFMEVAGTSPKYKGLYACVREARPASKAELAAVRSDLPGVSKPKGIVGSMAAIARKWDILEVLQKNGWRAHADHPDIDPLNEAKQVRTLFGDLVSSKMVADAKADLRGWMQDADRSAKELEAAITSNDFEAAEWAYQCLAASCMNCHTVYRNEH